MWLLLNHPNELKRARQDPDALEKLPDEVLRLAGAIPMTLRVATEDITLGDHVVARGDLIGIGLLAANRDPAVFPDPDRLDLSRPRPRLMSFSRSEEHTSELQSLMRISYSVFCLQK